MTSTVASRPTFRAAARGAMPEHYAAASPEAYKTALIHQTERLRLARAELASARRTGSPDHVRLARQRVIAIYRELHALREAVGPARAAAWKLEDFDVDAAWATWGTKLPPLADLNADERIPPIGGAGRLAFMGGSAVVGVLGAMLAALAGVTGTIGWAPLLRFAAVLRAHPALTLGAAALLGFAAGWPLVAAMNRALGYERGPDPIPD